MAIVKPVVTTQMNRLLIAPYTLEEVKKALFQIGDLKAPGPDGFPAHFYQRHWDICGEEVTKLVLRIVRGQESPECINDTILVLIPKVTNPTNLSQFRPISLCNVIYMVVVKCLVNRLRPLLDDIISPAQSAFVLGWMIIDNVLVAFECIGKRSGKEFLCLQVGSLKGI